MAFGIFELTIGVVLLLIWCYVKFSGYDYWKKLGIPGPRPVPVLGNFPSALLGRTALVEEIEKTYNQWKSERFFGVFNGFKPSLVINDPELAKTILIRDFNTFPGRGIHVPQNDDSIASNIFNLDGHRWKVLRSKLTPVFTTGKLKHMVDLIQECSDNFERYLIEEVKKNNVIEMREAAAKFGTDVIGSCAFGINMNAMSNAHSEFRNLGRKIFASNKANHFKKIIQEVAPGFSILLRKLLRPESVTKFFNQSIKETMDYREKESVSRGDLVDILREMKSKKNEMDINLTDNILAAQAFVFFAAGFETSSTTISFVMFELALAQDCQDKLRREIRDTLDKHNGKLSYEVINDMKYLDMVVKETLRKDSPALSLRRESVTPWTIPGTDITLPAKTMILIPIYSFHHNEEYFKNPDDFDPSRFDDERKSEIIPGSYLPFGNGPKNCIGERFAIYQTKLGIVSILKNFKVQPSQFTKKNYKIDKMSIVLAMEGGVPLKLIPFE